ncbi:LysE/ArgO family amino acid transporter [Lonepinella sp. MS14436]|uniref:LysE/ArgO family amino acid transporter n=1 Tax=unclassified Lonepinella TaxID=2642006 RepID=UPI0036DE30F8
MFIKGILVSASLIMAIGSQNLFVLKNGLRQNHVLLICLVCFLCDFVLISIGVMGVGALFAQNPYFSAALALLGGLFLLTYGFWAFKSSLYPQNKLDLSGEQVKFSAKNTLFATLAITLLNPHVYLDTVVILGGIAGTMSFDEKLLFLIGASLSSFVWFFGLGFGAKLLIPLFKNPTSWRVLDFVVGCIMFWIAYELLSFFVRVLV